MRRQQVRDGIAGGIAIVGLTLGIASSVGGGLETGIRLAVAGDHLVVSEVLPYSRASLDGLEQGTIVLFLNGRQLYALPAYIYPDEAPADPNVTPAPIGVEPPEPRAVPIDPEELAALAATPVQYVDVIRPIDLETGSPDNWNQGSYWYYPDFGRSLIPLSLGALILVGGWFLLRGGRLGESIVPLALPLSVAVSMPFVAQPIAATWWIAAIVVAGLLTTVAMLPLADGLAERIGTEPERRQMVVASAFCAAAALIVVGLMVQARPTWTSDVIRWAVIGAIPLLPGLAAAGPINLDGWRSASASSGRLLQSTEFAVAGATPFFAIGSARDPGYVPLILWLSVLVIAARFTVRPLARLVTRAQLQRDLVVAATEAERARLAADIHDDALQELTLLVRRLEIAGDEEGAELGRTVAERLRAICGDLRLPILDDLGVGPALDWLVLRIERLAGGEVRLERSDGSRHSPDVELAVFRVAQEALSNAVKHGNPPIVVRYQSSPTGISLSIDDSGPGIGPGAGEAAERAGHFGLLNMQQRAEAIGAILDVRRWPSGGTHVALEWRAG